jgi:hypothetical protein
MQTDQPAPQTTSPHLAEETVGEIVRWIDHRHRSAKWEDQKGLQDKAAAIESLWREYMEATDK